MGLNASTIPSHMGTDTVPRDMTQYYGINLNNGLPGPKCKTAVFFPDSMQAGLEITVVLYLQGYTDALSPIDVFLKHSDFALREKVKEPGKGAFIFVAPTLRGVLSGGKKSALAGDLVTDPDSYLKQVMNGLFQHGPFGAVPTVEKIVLAAHSAGGQWLLPIANKLTSRVHEVWCFDCLYWGGDWIRWIKGGHQLERFWAYSLGGGTLATTQGIKDQAKGKFASVDVTVPIRGTPQPWNNLTPANHDVVPKTFLAKLVETSSALN